MSCQISMTPWKRLLRLIVPLVVSAPLCAEGPWGIGASLCAPADDAKKVYGTGVGLEISRQFFMGGVLEGRVRLSGFIFQRGRKEFPHLGRLNAKARGASGTYDFMWNVGRDTQKCGYILLGLGLASYTYEYGPWSARSTHGWMVSDPGQKHSESNLAISPGVGWRLAGLVEFEVRCNLINTPLLDDFGRGLTRLIHGYQEPNFSPNHVSYTVRYRF